MGLHRDLLVIVVLFSGALLLLGLPLEVPGEVAVPRDEFFDAGIGLVDLQFMPLDVRARWKDLLQKKQFLRSWVRFSAPCEPRFVFL